MHAAATLCGAAVLWATGAQALAGRPMVTDDASLVEQGACQLQDWNVWARDEGVASLTLGCNPFGNTELTLGAGRATGDAAAGLGSATVPLWQVKQLLRGYDDQSAGFALALSGARDPRVYDSGIGSVALSGITTVPLHGDALLADLNLGALSRRDGAGAARRLRALWGIGLDGQLAGPLRVSVESFGIGGDTPRWQAGLLYPLLPGQLQLDFSVGSAFGRFAASREWALGLVFVTPRFLP